MSKAKTTGTKQYKIDKRRAKNKTKRNMSAKQRRIHDLTNKQRKNLHEIKRDVFNKLLSISHIQDRSKNPNKKSKKDFKKGSNANLGVEGIHSVKTFIRYREGCNTFVTFCVRHYDIRTLGDIKPKMVDDFFAKLIEMYIRKDRSAKTIKHYMNALLKLEEAGKLQEMKIQKQNLKLPKHKRKPQKSSLTSFLKARHREMVGEVKYKKEDYKRGADGGYSLEEAKIIERKVGVLFGEYWRVMIRILWEAGPRISELKRIKFGDFKLGGYTGAYIELFHPNQNKNDRPRRVPISLETYDAVMELWEEMEKRNQIQPYENIWGRLPESLIRARVKASCIKKVYDPETGKQVGRTVPYSGIHDFRKATISYFDQLFVKYGNAVWDAENLASAIIWHVDFHLLDNSGNPIQDHLGRVWKPLNAIVCKYNYVPSRDGMRKKYRIDTSGNYIYDYKYKAEELAEWDIRSLRNALESQILGHNRTDVVGEAYRTWKNTNVEKLWKKNPPKRVKRKK